MLKLDDDDVQVARGVTTSRRPLANVVYRPLTVVFHKDLQQRGFAHSSVFTCFGMLL